MDQNEPTELLILDSVFRNNSARPDYDLSLPRASIAFGHGGALNLRFVSASNGRVCIQRTVFEGNFAEANGGAIAASLARLASHNRITIRDTVFNNNFCILPRCTAGAFGVDLFHGTSHNTMLFENVSFTGNKADSGGAIVLATSVSAVSTAEIKSDNMKLVNCSFDENRAFFEGTAVAIFSLTQANEIGFPLDIDNW